MRPGDVLGNRFVLLERIASSGASLMWRGHDQTRDVDVAIKTVPGSVDPHDLDRFRLEASILHSLIHPNIARFAGFGSTPAGEYWIAQQWCAGPTLRRHLDRNGATAREAVGMARQVASALGEAHLQKVVHRDVKPGNIIAHESAWLLVDFGVARIVGEPIRLTRTGTVIGTLGYMAPEQARGEREVDARADVFALGCVLYEALAGRPPFVGDNALAIRAAVIAVDHPPLWRVCPPELPAVLTDLVDSCLVKNPDLRPADGSELMRGLLAIEEVGIPDTPRRQIRRDEPPTEVVAAPKLVSVVLAAPVADLAPDAVEAWRRRVSAACGGGAPAVLRDGAVVYRAASLTDAADAALAIRRERPGHPIAIATCDESQLGPTLAATAAVIERATYAALFADHAAAATPGVRIDTTTAGHLGSEYVISDIDDTCYLVGRRPAIGAPR